MTHDELLAKVKKMITQVADEQGLEIKELSNDTTIVDDLAFNSLSVAVLIAYLEEEFKVDPFSMGIVTISEVRTIDNIASAYEKGLKAL